MKRLAPILLLLLLLPGMGPAYPAYVGIPVGGYNVQMQPAGSLDVTNQTQLSSLSSSLEGKALTGSPSADPTNFQTIVNYVATLSASSPLRTLWFPNGVYYINGNSVSTNTGPITLIGQSKTGAILRRPVITSGGIGVMLQTSPVWTTTDSALGAAASGTNTNTVSGNTVTTNNSPEVNFAPYVGRTVFNTYNSVPLSPPATPSVALNSTVGASPGPCTNGVHQVAVSYVTQYGGLSGMGFETTLSTAASITVSNNYEIVVTLPPWPTGAIAQNVYMTEAGGSAFYCVSEGQSTVPIGTGTPPTTYTINIADGTGPGQLAVGNWHPISTNNALVANYASGTITSGGMNTFTCSGGLGGTPISNGLITNNWNYNDYYQIEIDSPPLTVQNLTFDGNWPNQWFMVGAVQSVSNGGNTVTDTNNNFTNAVANTWGAKDCTQNISVTSITGATTNSFTTSGVTWQVGDQYAIAVSFSEFEGLLAIFGGDSSTPGKLTAVVNNVNFINERASYGIYMQNDVNLTATNLYGANITSVICPVESNCVMNVTGMSDDGIGTATAIINGITIPGLGNEFYHYENDGDAIGYGVGKYKSAAYPLAGAPNLFTLNNVSMTNMDTLEQNPAGNYCTDTYNNLQYTGGLNGGFTMWDLDTDTTTFNGSSFNSGFGGDDPGCFGAIPGTTFQMNTCSFAGTAPTASYSGGTWYGDVVLNQNSLALLPYAATFTNCIFDVGSSVTSQIGAGTGQLLGAAAVAYVGTPIAGSSITLVGGTVSANMTYGIIGPLKCEINGTLFNCDNANAGFLIGWQAFEYSACAGFSLTIDNPQYGTGANIKYLNIGPSTGSITQTDVILPSATNSIVYACTNGSTWPSGITVSGRKTIIGPTTSAPTNVCAFGDDLLGTGNGDLYQDAPTGYVHQYRCLKTVWWDSSGDNTYRVNGGGSGAWVQIQ